MKTVQSHQKLEEARKASALEPPEEMPPCQHLDFGSLTPELWENTFLLFWKAWFVLIAMSKLINLPCKLNIDRVTADVYLALILCSFTWSIILNFHNYPKNLELFLSLVQMRKRIFWVTCTKIHSVSRWWNQNWVQVVWLLLILLLIKRSLLLLITMLSVRVFLVIHLAFHIP